MGRAARTVPNFLSGRAAGDVAGRRLKSHGVVRMILLL